MKLQFKRWFAGLLAVILVLYLIPSMALADTGSDGSGEQPRLLMMGLDPDPEGNYPLWDFSSCEPGGGADVHFYYGTTEDKTPVTDVKVTAGDSVMVTAQTTEDGEAYWNIQYVKFGTSTLAITTANDTYTQEVTVGLPWEGYYSAQNRSEATYLPQVAYVKANGNTFWLMREEGFSVEELGIDNSDNSNPLIVTLDDNVLEAASVTPELRTGSTDRYDLKIMLPAGLDLSAGRFWLQVQNSVTDNQFRGIEVQQPQLLLRWLEWDEETQTFYENTECDFGDLSSCELGNGFMVCLYYGTPESYVPVTGITVSGSSGEATTETLRDGGTCWNIQCIALGESTLMITVGGENYTQKINVTLPEYGFYTDGTLDGAHFVSSCKYNDLSADKTLWLMCADGFTQDELAKLTVTLNNNAITTTDVPRDPSADPVVYDVKVTLPKMDPSQSWCELQATLEQEDGEPWYIARCEIAVKGAAAYAGGYVEGFYFYIADDVPCFTEGDGNYGNSHRADEYTGEYVQFQEDMKIGASVKQFDAQGGAYYTLVGSDQVQITISRVWLESICGTVGTFSLSQTAEVSERSDLGTLLQFPLYYKPGHEEGVLVHADLSITVNGETTTADVSQYCFADVRVMETIDRPAGDTVTDLNNYLQNELYTNRVAKGVYTINLASTTYTGTIVIPTGFEEKDGQEVELILAGAENGNTVIRGGIDLNGNYLGNLENITFDGNKSTASALYNGSCLNMSGCTFQGYTGAAVDGSSGMMTVTSGNVFLDNTIAVKINAAAWGDHFSTNLNPWLNNTYIKNGTAVQILSLNEAVSSHNLRLYDSDFIDNGTDFDAQCGGTLYFYRNYFGSFESSVSDPVAKFSAAKALNDFTSLLTSRKVAIYTENNTTVIVNPRWKYPVKNLGEAPTYRNYLISDWTLPTQILNTEASNLKLDASAFEEEGTKTITVVDEQDQPVGTWIFD